MIDAANVYAYSNQAYDGTTFRDLFSGALENDGPLYHFALSRLMNTR